MKEDDLLRRTQVALLFGVFPPTVTRWAREGRIPSVLTPGGQRRFPKQAIQRLLEDLRRGAGNESDGGPPKIDATVGRSQPEPEGNG